MFKTSHYSKYFKTFSKLSKKSDANGKINTKEMKKLLTEEEIKKKKNLTNIVRCSNSLVKRKRKSTPVSASSLFKLAMLRNLENTKC